jgi:hypothetical protein
VTAARWADFYFGFQVAKFMLSIVGSDRACVKTLTKIFDQKIDRFERPSSDDRHLGNGFGTPNFSASLINFGFLHRLAAQEQDSRWKFLWASSVSLLLSTHRVERLLPQTLADRNGHIVRVHERRLNGNPTSRSTDANAPSSRRVSAFHSCHDCLCRSSFPFVHVGSV